MHLSGTPVISAPYEHLQCTTNSHVIGRIMRIELTITHTPMKLRLGKSLNEQTQQCDSAANNASVKLETRNTPTQHQKWFKDRSSKRFSSCAPQIVIPHSFKKKRPVTTQLLCSIIDGWNESLLKLDTFFTAQSPLVISQTRSCVAYSLLPRDSDQVADELNTEPWPTDWDKFSTRNSCY